MAVKRRVIWLNDEDWATLARESTARDCSISSLISAWLRDEWEFGSGPPTPISDDQTVLDRFNSRPFTPVPKRAK